MKFLRLVVLIALIVMGRTGAGAQPGTTERWEWSALPPQLVLVRGSALQVSGRLDGGTVESEIEVRVNGYVRSSKTVSDGNWSVLLDTGAEKKDLVGFSVWVGPTNRAKQRILTTGIKLVDTPPARLIEPADDAQISGPISFTVDLTSRNLVTGIAFHIDDTAIPAQIDEHGHGSLDPVGLQSGDHSLTALIRYADGYAFRLRPTSVSVVDRVRALPLETGSELSFGAVNGYIQLRSAIARDISVKQVQYQIDATTVAVAEKPPFESVWWNPVGVKKGSHDFRILCEDHNGHVTASTPVAFDVTQTRRKPRSTEDARPEGPIHLPTPDPNDVLEIELARADDTHLVYPLAGVPPKIVAGPQTSIRIIGSYSLAKGQTIAVRDGARIIASSVDPEAVNLALKTSELGPGQHSLRIQMIGNDTPVTIATTELRIFGSAPVALTGSIGTAELTQPITLSVRSEPDYAVESVSYFVDGRQVTTDPATRKTAIWDVRNERPGSCTLWAIVKGRDGTVARTAPVKITVPMRITVKGPIGVVKNTSLVRLPIRVVLAPSLAPTAADYELDGRVAATVTSQPFDSFDTPPSLFDGGVHTLKVHVTDLHGARYVSKPWRFGISRTDDDFAKVDAALSIRKQLDEREEERRQSADALRQRIAFTGDALGGGRRGNGALGYVNGLAVVTNTLTFSNGLTIKVGEWGELSPILASFVPGVGRLIFQNTLADQYPLIAARNAVAYSHRKAQDDGFLIDWQSIDVKLGFLAKGPIGGDSGGAASATAIMSLITKRPVDRSTAITGTVDASGRVGDVGGVNFKESGAFSNPSIRTVIIPDVAESRADFFALFDARPGLFVNRRVIIASRMDEVLRQALIGYDAKYATAEAWIHQGITDFVEGYDEDALQDFGHAEELTPENFTIAVWKRGISRAMRAPVE
ncbi:MAG TPA: S16 family serine protease [Chthonomonadaceae bacterium]|nr:S16 family serine protease [Chthonomonadaceae bacterium]